MQLIRNFFTCARPANSLTAPADSPMAAAPAAQFSRAPSLALRPVAPEKLQQRQIQAGPSSGLRARLLGWVAGEQSPEAAQRKCLRAVVRCADQFHAQHARASRRGAAADPAALLQAWQRAYAAGCSTAQIVDTLAEPDLLLSSDMQARLRALSGDDPRIDLLLNTLQAVRIAHCDSLSEKGLKALGNAAPRFVALASLVELYGSFEVAMGSLPEVAQTELRACYAQAMGPLPLPKFLQILNHAFEGTMRRAALAAEIQQSWLALRPVNKVEPSSPQQATQQQLAKEGLRRGFEQLIAAHHKPALLLPWSRLNGLADAIVAARKAGMTDDMIAAEFCQRPLTVQESRRLKRQLAHKYLLGWGRDVVEQAQILLLRSNQSRQNSANKVSSVAAGPSSFDQ